MVWETGTISRILLNVVGGRVGRILAQRPGDLESTTQSEMRYSIPQSEMRLNSRMKLGLITLRGTTQYYHDYHDSNDKRGGTVIGDNLREDQSLFHYSLTSSESFSRHLTSRSAVNQKVFSKCATLVVDSITHIHPRSDRFSPTHKHRRMVWVYPPQQTLLRRCFRCPNPVSTSWLELSQCHLHVSATARLDDCTTRRLHRRRQRQ